MAPSRNPIGFTPLPVTILTSAVYIALFAALLVVHHVVPSAPSTPTPEAWNGVNISEAWLDLQDLSKTFHPYNSKANVETRSWLLSRVGDILEGNGIDWKTVTENATRGSPKCTDLDAVVKVSPRPVTVFDDSRSNVTYRAESWGDWITYFEGTNIMVYIRGTDDDDSDWWTKGTQFQGAGGVLVNAHYDSVSTGFGATDDGVGVVTILQLISHFTTKGNQPKKGILALLNNGEEDGLYGAYAFAQHPISRFPHTFLNLEGAGAGGRAALFRSTDTEVTKFYADSKYPFGTVLSADGFKRGIVRSGTDYSVFTEKLGMRGLDVAFMAPRARYHTSQDDSRDTSIDSLWHMLSAALATVEGLSDDTSSTFNGTSGGENGKVNAGKGTIGVWFDLFGRAFAVLELHTLFALSVALLVAGPILLIALEIVIQKSDKWYMFARNRYLRSSDDDEPVKLLGWRGFFRFPLAFVVASAAVVALAYLITKINPHVLYSSEYAIWTMMLTAWVSVAWFLLRLVDSFRPSALSRMYALLWLYVLAWIALVAITVGENNLHLGSGYFVVFYNAAIFVALLISYLEFFALPKKGLYAEHAVFGPDAGTPGRPLSISSSRQPDHADERPASSRGVPADADDDNERTSLLNNRQTFTRYGAHNRRSEDDGEDRALLEDPLLNNAYEGEQAWSSSLPRWTWLLQFLLVGPINIILVGQIALVLTSGLHQTPADGNSVLLIYMLMAGISILLLIPLAPFLHRFHYHIPTFLFLVFIGTLVYNLLAFPFSRDARLKTYFVQRVDLDTGANSVALFGLQPYLADIVSQLPSAAGQTPRCGADAAPWAPSRAGLDACAWSGLGPVVVSAKYLAKPPGVPYPNTTSAAGKFPRAFLPSSTATNYSDWVQFSARRPHNGSELEFELQGFNTRACRIYLDAAVANVSVDGGSSLVAGADKNAKGRRDGESSTSTQIRLWSREWDAKWRVGVTLAAASTAVDLAAAKDDAELAISPSVGSSVGIAKKGKKSGDGGDAAWPEVHGSVVCIWSDANQVGTIPALDEVKRFMPVWSAVSKASDGLVEGEKAFVI